MRPNICIGLIASPGNIQAHNHSKVPLSRTRESATLDPRVSGFQDHFSELAAKYAGFRPHYPATLFDYLTTLVPADGVVWECACGSGQATLDLAARFRHIVATDGSPEQIAAAPAHPRVEYRVATAEDCGLEDASVHLVAVAQAIHWFNLEKFYAEARRVLRPGGVIAAWAYGINHVEGQEVDSLVQKYYSETVGPYWPPERVIVEAGYSTIPFPFAELLGRQLAIEVDWTLEQLLGYFSSWSATNRYIKANGINPLEPLSAALRPLWGDAGRVRRVRWPLALRVGRKE